MQTAEFMNRSSNSVTSNRVTMRQSNENWATVRAALPIDWRQLSQLSDGNEEFELELLEIFAIETGKLLHSAHQAVIGQDAQTLHHVAHQIKGGSGNIGMVEMVRFARELEQQAHKQDWHSAVNCLDQISRSLSYVQNFLQAP
jgi:histidine phosphotransfer protein HptB